MLIMMALSRYFCFCIIAFGCWFHCVSGHPLKTNENFQVYEIPHGITISTVLSICFVIPIIFVLSFCVCCSNHNVKNLGKQNGNAIHHRPSNNSSEVANTSEFTIFPPSSAIVMEPNNFSDDKVTFEPLPDILSRGSSCSQDSQPLRLAKCFGSFGKGLDDWFDEPLCKYFPRSQLQYHQELGTSWFGQVVIGEAQSIVENQAVTKVIVKILKQDATPTDYVHFLQEIRPFRDLNHSNIVKLLGYCLEKDPYLFIVEYCPIDLKTYLINHCDEAQTILQNNYLLHITCNIAEALQHMHDHNFVHMDLAARNCFLSSDFVIKLGDYGTSLQTYKDDYYCRGNIALPLRWCDPDSISCTTSMMEMKEINSSANVWSFGVLLWEIFEFGKLPYFELTDEEVLQKVLIDRNCYLEIPSTSYSHKYRIYQIMQLCWNPIESRPKIHKIASLLNHLYDNKDAVSDSAAFESRWVALKSQTSEHNLFIPSSNQIPRVTLQFENDFVSNSEKKIKSNSEHILTENSSPSRDSTSISLELASVSPSLQNLRGSIEDNTIMLCKEDNSLEQKSDCSTVFSSDKHSNIISGKITETDNVNSLISPFVPDESMKYNSTQQFEMQECKTEKSSILEDKCTNNEEIFNKVIVNSEHSNSIHEQAQTCDSGLSIRSLEKSPEQLFDSIDNEKYEKQTSPQLQNIHVNTEHNVSKVSSLHPESPKNPSEVIVKELENIFPDSYLSVENETIEHISVNENSLDLFNDFENEIFQKAPIDIELDMTKILMEKDENTNDQLYTKGTDLTHNDNSELCNKTITTNQEWQNIESAILMPKNSHGFDEIVNNCNNHCTSTPLNISHTIESSESEDNHKIENDDKEVSFVISEPTISQEEKLKSVSSYYTATETALHSDIDHNSIANNHAYEVTTEENTDNTSTYFDAPDHKYDSLQTMQESLGLELNSSSNYKQNSSLVAKKTVEEMDAQLNNVDQTSRNNSDESSDTSFISSSVSFSERETKLDTTSDNDTSDFDILPVSVQNNSANSILISEPNKINLMNDIYDGAASLPKYKQQHFEHGDVTNIHPEQILLDKRCSLSSEGDEYQLDDITNALKEVSYVNNAKVFNSRKLSLTDSNNESIMLNTEDQAGPSNLSADHMFATCVNYWTDRMSMQGHCCTSDERTTDMKNMTDVITLEDLDTGDKKDIIPCYEEPYQDPFESDEVLRVDTETNIAVLLDSSQSVIGFVPSKSADSLSNRHRMEDIEEGEVYLPSEIENDLSKFGSNACHNQLCINGYQSSDSLSSSHCSTSSDLSINIDQQSETSSDSVIVPDVPEMHHLNNGSFTESNDDFNQSQESSENPSDLLNFNNVNLSFETLENLIREADNAEMKDSDDDSDDNLERKVKGHYNLDDSKNTHLCPQVTLDKLSPVKDYTPDFDSDTDDTSSTGTSCTSTSGSFECLYKNDGSKPEDVVVDDNENSTEESPIQIFSSTWDRKATPTKSSMKSPEKKVGQMKKSVSFQEEDPPLFSYPPESEESDDESRGFDYVGDFLWNVDYSVYTDWDFQSSLDAEEIPEDVVEVEDPDQDDEYLSFRYKALPLQPFQVYSFTDITDDDFSESASLKTNPPEIRIQELENGEDAAIRKLDHSPSVSPIGSIPDQVCEEVLESFPHFSDISDILPEDDKNESPCSFEIFNTKSTELNPRSSKYVEMQELEYDNPMFCLTIKDQANDNTKALKDIYNNESHEFEMPFTQTEDVSFEINEENEMLGSLTTEKSKFLDTSDAHQSEQHGEINNSKIETLEARNDYILNQIDLSLNRHEFPEFCFPDIDNSDHLTNESIQLINDLVFDKNTKSTVIDSDVHLTNLSLAINNNNNESDPADLNSSDVLVPKNVADDNSECVPIQNKISSNKSHLNSIAHEKELNEIQTHLTGDDKTIFVVNNPEDKRSTPVIDTIKLDSDCVNISDSFDRNYKDDASIINPELKECAYSVLYEIDVQSAQNDSSTSSKSTEDTSEQDSAISSSGEFSPTYSPNIIPDDLQNKDITWDFNCTDNHENMNSETNGNFGDEKNITNSSTLDKQFPLLPTIVISDSDNANAITLLQECNNCRFENNGNICDHEYNAYGSMKEST